MPILISDKSAAWQQECNDRFNIIRNNEEELDDGVKVNYEKLQTDGDGTKHKALGRV